MKNLILCLFLFLSIPDAFSFNKSKIESEFLSKYKSATEYDKEYYDRINQLIPIETLVQATEKLIIGEEKEATIFSDMDLSNFDSPIKSQGNRPYCTAYAITNGMDNLNKGATNLDAIHLFNNYNRYSLELGLSAAKLVLTPNNPKTDIDYRLSAYKRLNDLLDIKKALLNLHPVVLALQVPEDMARCKEVISIDNINLGGGHAVELVGFFNSDKISGGFFKIKQSWSPTCGVKGYQYINLESWCKKSYCYAWELESVENNKASICTKYYRSWKTLWLKKYCLN